ncbi:hypothetical protein A0J48_019505 [Sphaerospermopsis aphanizomenoides BCCUSP55]|uniref:hypothetical protein n=1 Tax=Sphaerospermopsis aphanizomenoides TaxID=459663 RepID=UPI00190319BB|nr:hypothetical protein [Sphaerospermopsis aphanizomenoides]MBK1989693.1 hypothetical protein [Sphaerospermopsis aphanizomenoides BCCUSP55]
MELPTDLYWQCKKVFQQCQPFENDELLSAFCEQEEFSFLVQDLKKADSLSSRVMKNLPILLKGKHRKYGFIFPSFVKALRDNCHQENARWSEINDLYVKIEQISVQAQALDKQFFLDKQTLFNRILDIDFDEQEDKVITSLDWQNFSHKTAAFLVHGNHQFGQLPLVTRLLQLRELNNGERMKIVVKLSNHKNIYDVWEEVARRFVHGNQPTGLSPEQIMDKIFQALRFQNLIFIFYEIYQSDRLSFLDELIQDFWQPIVEQANHKETYLVMFLIDNKGGVCKSGISLADEVNHPQYPKIPLSLPPGTQFPRTKLASWLRVAVRDKVVPESLCIDTLLADSQEGVPELVYKRICEYCNTSWEGDLAQKLIQVF